MTSRPVSPSITRIPVTRVIDCAECSMFASEHCSDCVVTYLCDPVRKDSGVTDQAEIQEVLSPETSPGTAPVPSTAVVFDLEELRAVRLLAEAGLVPSLRHSAVG